MNIAIAHDYFLQKGGAERVAELWMERFPAAKVYTSAINYTLFSDVDKQRIRSTWLQYLPLLKRRFKWFFPIYGSAFRNITAEDVDVALVSSSAFAHHIQWGSRTRIAWYCHNPPRFLWRTDDYLQYETKNPLLRGMSRMILSRMKKEDIKAASRVHRIIANSNTVRERIRKIYGIDAPVVFPPVRVEKLKLSIESERYYLIISRLVGYKRIDRAIEAFNMNGRELRIVGSGPDLGRLRSLAKSNIKFLGRRTDSEVEEELSKCRALIFPGLEDFGIVPVEANATGKPVIALGEGGALDTIIPGKNGLYFDAQKEHSLNEAVEQLEGTSWNPLAIRNLAERFSEARHLENINKCIEQVSLV